MEQLFTFIGIIFACVLAVIIESPILFGISFAGGILYHVLRGKIKGWSLPKDVKDRHSW
jgi:hypothetical protein